jgi:exopolysaccharide biosynthesis polyprenyl glycosylphosphotransferase
MSISLPAFTHKLKQWLVDRRFAITLPQRRALLMAGDVAIINLSALAALRIWAWRGEIPFDSSFLAAQIEWFVAFNIVWLVTAWSADLYDVGLAGRWSETVRRVGGIGGGQLVLYLIVFFLSPRNALPRLFFLYYLVISIPLLLLLRWAYASFVTRSVFRQRLVIVGAGWAGRALADAVRAHASQNYLLVGFIDDNPAKVQENNSDLPLLGTSACLSDLVRRHQVDSVVVAITGQMQAGLFQTLLDCQAAGVPVIRMSTLYEALTGRVPVEHVRGDWLLPADIEGGQQAWVYRLFTLGVDWVFGLAGLGSLVILWPLIMLAIKLDSSGPALYRQTRVGLGGRIFHVYKFRSMVADAEEDGIPRWAGLDDERVTRVGRFLRRTRLDELPQVLNILRGDMHLVGPRPERPEFMHVLQQKIPFYSARLAVKPGLTGWAQVKFGYGNSIEDTLIKLQYDLYYIRHRSVALDLLILLKTAEVVLIFRGM